MRIKRLAAGLLQANCYVLISGHEAAVVDPGGEADRILEETEGMKVKHVILTHYHYDHSGASNRLRSMTKAEVLIHEAEKPLVDFQVDRFLKEGDKVIIGQDELEIVHTPGHSPGSICLFGKGVVFTGDTLFEEGYGRTDLSGGSHEDIGKSLLKLSKLIKPNTLVYPGHGEPFKSK